MTKYIDVEKYNDELNKIEDFICGDAIYGIAFARAALNKMSAADVQSVVHCKDCIHRHKPEDCCPMCSTDMNDNVFDLTEDNNFCKYGDEHEQ